jgi:ADP-ribose pyrophosphatase YjhB (NUDIX family)
MKTFYVGVKGLIINDGKVLLVRGETTGRDFWDTPGGRMDDDETITQTLDRELREEHTHIRWIPLAEAIGTATPSVSEALKRVN